MVQIVNTLRGAHAAVGATVGADELPGFLLDAVRVCDGESGAADVAKDEALNQT